MISLSATIERTCSTHHTQVNFVTAWIDGSSIYGPSSSWSDSLRSFYGGLLTSGSEWNMPNQASGRTFMWSAADPSTGDHGPQGLYGETFSPTPNPDFTAHRVPDGQVHIIWRIL